MTKTRCPYCNQHLLLKTFEEHKRLYYDTKSDQWCANLKESDNSSLDFSDNSDPPSDISSLNSVSEPESYYGDIDNDSPITASQVSSSGNEDEKPLSPVERDGQETNAYYDNSSLGEEWDDSDDTDIDGPQKNATQVESQQSQAAKSLFL